MFETSWGGSWGELPNSSWGESWGSIEGHAAGAAWACTWGQTWGASWGDTSHCDVTITPPAATIPGGNYYDWWQRELRRIIDSRKKKKLPKKKRKLVEELEDKAEELALIASEGQATWAYTQEIRRQVSETTALLNQAYQAKITNDRLQREIAILEAYIQELDDEDAIILALYH